MCVVELWLFHVPLTSPRQQDWQKIHVGAQLWSRWRSDPEVAQLFCSRRTIQASALLSFGFFTYRSPHHGSKICQKNHVKAQLESRWRSNPQIAQLFCSARTIYRTIMARALLNFGCLRHCSPHDGGAPGQQWHIQ